MKYATIEDDVASLHRPTEVKVKVLQVLPTPSDDVDQDAQPPISFPDEHETPRWMAYYHTVDRILGHRTNPDLNLAMRQAAAACGVCQRVCHQQETGTPHQDLRSIVSYTWCEKQHLHTTIHCHDPHTQ